MKTYRYNHVYIYICLSSYATTVVLWSSQDALSKGFLHCWMPLLFYTREMREWTFIHMHEHSWKSSSHLLDRITQLTSNEKTACLTEISWSMSFLQSYWILLNGIYVLLGFARKKQKQRYRKFQRIQLPPNLNGWNRGPTHHIIGIHITIDIC